MDDVKDCLCMLFVLIAGLFGVAPVFAAEAQPDTCLQCMRIDKASHEGCQRCAHYVQQMMATSNFDHLSSLLESLKKSAYKNCGEHGLQSKACQVYHALCQDDYACDHDLLAKLADVRDLSAVDQVLA